MPSLEANFVELEVNTSTTQFSNPYPHTVQPLFLCEGAKRGIFYHITVILLYCLDKMIARSGDMSVMSKSARPKDLTDKISFGLTKY